MRDERNLMPRQDLSAHGCATAAPSSVTPAHTPLARRVLPFLIRRDGTWLYRGTPITRKPMVCLFASMLTRDAEGTFWMRTPTESGTIQVEDAPFLAVALDFHGTCGRRQNLCFRTNVDEVVCAGPDHPLLCHWDAPCAEDCAGAVPYLTVRSGEGGLPIQARLTRAVYYELAALAVPGHADGRPCMGVWSQDVFFPLGPMPGAGHDCMDDL